MSAWLLFIAMLIVAYFGFALLALGQHKHRQAVMGVDRQAPFRPVVPRCLGGLTLAASLALALLRDGPSFGVLLWVTVLSTTALAVAFTLAWRPKWLRPLASCFD